MFKLTAASAVMLQFFYIREDIRIRVERAFTALGNPDQAEALLSLGAEILRFLTRRGPDTLFDCNYPSLDTFGLTTAEYHGFGEQGIEPRNRGIRLIRHNGPAVRAYGGTSDGGHVDMLFFRLTPDQWKEFMTALELDPEGKGGWPTWITPMPAMDPELNLAGPMSFC